MKRGRLIVFEGIGGSGKSSAGVAAAQALTDAGYPVLATRQPGGSALGTKIRELVLDPRYGAEVDANVQLFLYAADRYIHVEQVIKPALAAGKIVLSDRYDHSTRAYQAAGGGDPEALEVVNSIATGGLRPDRTYWFDLPPETALERIHRAGRAEADRFDLEKLPYWQKLHDSYARQFRDHPDEIHRIDAAQPPATVAAEVVADLLKFIQNCYTEDN